MTTTSISRDRKLSTVGGSPADTAAWEAFAEATTSRDARIAGPLGRKLAFSARHRKPNRRRAAVKAVLGTAFLVAAIVGGIGAAARTVQPAPFYGMTPGQAAQVATALEAPQRPYWDGRGAYTSGIEPLCYPSDRGHWAIAGPPGHQFRVVCVADGGWDVWTVQLAAQLAADITGTPAQEAAACTAVYHYHHMNATDYGGVHATATARAWYHAWHLAGYADTLQGDSMRYNIRHYLDTGRGWSLVAYDCNPDGTGP